MTKIGLCAAAAAFALAAGAVEWCNIGEDDYLAGVKISSPDKLKGRVVLVDVWGVNCPPCRALLPQLEEIWKNFGLPAKKPFIVLGSHRQARDDKKVKALIAKAGVTYPVYQGAGIAENEPSSGGAIPFLYVLNHRGKVIYRGRDIHAAQEAFVTAIGEVGRLPSLTDGVYFQRFKSMEPNLVFGKPIKPMLSKLEDAAAGKDAAAADEAKKILRAINKGLRTAKEEIDFQKENDPREAVRLIKLMKVTWPDEAAAAYKSELPALIAAAKKQKKQRED